MISIWENLGENKTTIFGETKSGILDLAKNAFFATD